MNAENSGIKNSVMHFMRTKVKAMEEHDEVDTSSIARRPVTSFQDLPEFKRLEAQRRAGEQLAIDNPFFRPHSAAAGALTTIGDAGFVNFASYDYLGLNQHPHVISRTKEALDRYAVSASASRVVGGERLIHRELESAIAAIYDVDAALVFVSGYLTNCSAISALMGPEDLVVHDEFIHNSILAGIKLSGASRRFFRHNDLDHLEEILEATAGTRRRVLVVVEGIYSMDGDIADLPELIALRNKHGFWLMVDEAHSLGVLGERGFGTFEHFGIDPRSVDIWMGTLSKTASSCGGYIAGSNALISILRAAAGGFVYSVGMPPALAAAALTSIELMRREPERTRQLKHNGSAFLNLAQSAGLDTGSSAGFSIVPVLVGDSIRAAKLSNELLADGINVLPVIHPAVPEGLARLRFFVTSEHSQQQLRLAVDKTAERLDQLVRQGVGVASVDTEALRDLL